MNDSEQSVLLEALEDELKRALQPLIVGLSAMGARCAAYIQRTESGTAPLELPQITAMRARAASRGK
jgi:hypothetical protein